MTAFVPTFYYSPKLSKRGYEVMRIVYAMRLGHLGEKVMIKKDIKNS